MPAQRRRFVGWVLVISLPAWQSMQTNVLLIVWMGLGGMMAVLAGPLALGSL